jgi:hypothetical protein
MYFKMDQPAKPQVQRSQCSIQHGRNHTANNIYKCWTSCNKCKYLFLQYSVSNQKHNSCKIYLKILQVVSKGRKNILVGRWGHRIWFWKGATQGPSILPSLVPIGPVVSEENIKIQKVNDGRTDGRRTPSGSKCSHDPWSGELKNV